MKGITFEYACYRSYSVNLLKSKPKKHMNGNNNAKLSNLFLLLDSKILPDHISLAFYTWFHLMYLYFSAREGATS